MIEVKENGYAISFGNGTSIKTVATLDNILETTYAIDNGVSESFGANCDQRLTSDSAVKCEFVVAKCNPFLTFSSTKSLPNKTQISSFGVLLLSREFGKYYCDF